MLPSLPGSVEAATDPDCRTCEGEGWVCENHPAKPWGGMSTSPAACDCGAGEPCACTGMNGRPD